MQRIGITIVLIFFLTSMFHAQEMTVPVTLQFALFFKILSYDRNLKTRVGEEIVIGIVYQTKFRTSLKTKDEIVEMMNKSSTKKIGDVQISVVSIDIDDTDLHDAAPKKKVDIFYITPLLDVGIEEIIEVSRAEKITTLTGVPDYVESGLAVAIGTKDEKPLIIINLKAAKAEGADFSSQLLKLAKVIN